MSADVVIQKQATGDRVQYGNDAVLVYCLGHPKDPMTYDASLGWWRCAIPECGATVSIFGPKRD